MNRRDFLGTLLGSLVLSGTDFYASGLRSMEERETLFYRYRRYLGLREEQLLKFRGVIDTTEGGLIKCPPLFSIKEGFKFEPLSVYSSFTTERVGLIDDEGFLLTKDLALFSRSLYLMPYDTLNITYTLLSNDQIKELLNYDYVNLGKGIIHKSDRAKRID